MGCCKDAGQLRACIQEMPQLQDSVTLGLILLVRGQCCYCKQVDLHYGELTVRETLDFSARCQSSGYQKSEPTAQMCTTGQS